MEATFRTSWTCSKHHSTALLLVCDGFHLAIDCPDTYRSVLRSAAERSGRTLSLSDIDHVLITTGVAFYKRFAEAKRVGCSRAQIHATRIGAT